jgi:5-methylcytosine-specific restriction endonuclease McrA
MGKRQRNWASRRRRYMSGLLGGKCVVCGTEVDLEFDCIEPCGDEHHKKTTSVRITFYWRQFLANNLQLLCEKCHARKSNNEHPRQSIMQFNSFNQENEDPF